MSHPALSRSSLDCFYSALHCVGTLLLCAQFQNLSGDGIGQFKDMSQQVVVWPSEIQRHRADHSIERGLADVVGGLIVVKRLAQPIDQARDQDGKIDLWAPCG